MARRHRQPRRHHWIALWAILALLLNQTVAASHFCPMAALGAPHTLTLAQPGCSHVDAASDAVASEVPITRTQQPSHQNAACSVHCTHAADGDQHGKAPVVPMLPTIGHDFSIAFLGTAMATRSGAVGVVRDSRQRRLYEFCTLLI